MARAPLLPSSRRHPCRQIPPEREHRKSPRDPCSVALLLTLLIGLLAVEPTHILQIPPTATRWPKTRTGVAQFDTRPREVRNELWLCLSIGRPLNTRNLVQN